MKTLLHVRAGQRVKSIMRIVSILRPRTAAVLYRRTKADLSRIFAVGLTRGFRFCGRSSAVCEGAAALRRQVGHRQSLDPCLGHRQPVRFGGTPAISAEPAFKKRFRSAHRQSRRGSLQLRRSFGESARGAIGKRKIVIWHSRISRMASALTLAWLIDFVGASGAVLTTLCWLPQAIEGHPQKETRALPLPATVAFSVGVVLWLVYGLAIGDWPLIGSNAATLALMAPILAMKLRYG